MASWLELQEAIEAYKSKTDEYLKRYEEAEIKRAKAARAESFGTLELSPATRMYKVFTLRQLVVLLPMLRRLRPRLSLTARPLNRGCKLLRTVCGSLNTDSKTRAGNPLIWRFYASASPKRWKMSANSTSKTLLSVTSPLIRRARSTKVRLDLSWKERVANILHCCSRTCATQRRLVLFRMTFR